jgi:hypothetical protein
MQNQDHDANAGKTRIFAQEPAGMVVDFVAVAGKYCRGSAARRSLESGVLGEP